MPVTDSPLRYPGGKSQLVPFVVELLRENGLFYGEYAEPFAGGAGIAMTLLLNGYVDRIFVNDTDPAIHAFWFCVLHRTDELCGLIERTPVTIDEWHAQRQIQLAGDTRQELRLLILT
ncbi:MAG: DNA adenine methylase [Pseudomonadota bacterium]|jgi:DNA adenine methylase